MSIGTAEEGTHALPWRGALPWLAGGACYLFVLAVGRNLLADTDSYWQLVIGRWILDHHAVPTSDTFSFTMTGAHWIAQEWLSEVAFTLAQQLGGWTGMAILAAAAVGLTVGLLTHRLMKDLSPTVAVIFALAAFLPVLDHILARPHVLVWPIIAAWAGGLIFCVDRRTAPDYRLLPLMTLWANLHGSFTFGLVLVAALGLEAVTLAERPQRLATARRWALFGILALMAASITPYGPEPILVTYRVLSLGAALPYISEWQPESFHRVSGFEVSLMLGLGFALWSGLRLRPVRIVMLLGLLHLALTATRNGDLFGLVTPLLAAGPAAQQFPTLRAWAAETSIAPLRSVALSILILLVPATRLAASFQTFTPRDNITPEAAVTALKASGAQRVLNDYNFGGYLIYSGVPTFFDSRTELFGERFALRYFRDANLLDIPDFLKLLDEYDIDATMFSPQTPAIGLLDRMPGWTRLYADDRAVIHVRLKLRPTLP